MITNNNFNINDLTILQYSQLMSPLRKERDKNGTLTERNVTWIRHALNHITTFFHRLFHAVSHKGHRWENDKTLLKKFKTGLVNVVDKKLDQSTQDGILLLSLMDKFKMDLKDLKNFYKEDSFSQIRTSFYKKLVAARKKIDRDAALQILNILDKYKDGFANIATLDDAILYEITLLGEELILRNPQESTKEINDCLKLHTNLSFLKEVCSDKGKKKNNKIRKPNIGRRDTMRDSIRRQKLTPTLDDKLLKKNLEEEDTDPVRKRRNEIKKTKALYKSQVEEDKKKNPERHLFIEKCLEEGELIPTSRGAGGAYWLKYGGVTKFVVKPNGEGTNCLDNRKTDASTGNLLSGYATDKDSRVRRGISLYFESLSEILYYRTAKLLNLQAYVPETFPVIIKSKEFFHRAKDPKSSKLKEKFCSAQQFATNKGRLSGFILVSKDRKTVRFEGDIDSFSLGANIFLDSVCGNTDRITDNCLLGTNNELINIDNGLCFPENNDQIRSFNVLLPQAGKEFDPFFRNLIHRISDEKDPLSWQFYRLIEEAQEQHANVNEVDPNWRSKKKYVGNVIKALKKRVAIMKWAIDKGMSMRETGFRVIALGAKDEEYAYRSEAIEVDDVATFHLGGERTIEWTTILKGKAKRNESRKEEEEEEEEINLAEPVSNTCVRTENVSNESPEGDGDPFAGIVFD